jgi:hypothetical protein
VLYQLSYCGVPERVPEKLNDFIRSEHDPNISPGGARIAARFSYAGCGRFGNRGGAGRCRILFLCGKAIRSAG